MFLNKIKLKNFRSIKDLELHFSPNTTQIFGENGSGKTSLLEAIYICSLGKSFYKDSLQDIITWENKSLSIEAKFTKSDVENITGVELSNGKKRYYHNGNSFSSAIGYAGNLYCVAIRPEDISIVIGSSSDKRDYLDRSLSLIDNAYLSRLARYHKALQQRNSLLKNWSRNSQDFTEIETWSDLLAKDGTYLTHKRRTFLEYIIQQLFGEILGSGLLEKVSLEYSPGGSEDYSQYIEKLSSSINKDLQFGYTTYGAHKDSFNIFFMENKKFSDVCSRGQARLLSILLKLGEAMVIKNRYNHSPILLVDDINAEIDQVNREIVLNYIKKISCQTIFTSISDKPILDNCELINLIEKMQ